VIKCVIWDLDNTLLTGVYLESADQPPGADPVLAGVLAELSGRGILQAIASRNPPEAGQYARQVTGHAFAAIQCAWGAKSASVAAIMTELDLTADAVAFVDDDALERAEVSFAQPGMLVLAPQDMADAVTWPQFSPPVVTDEARRRGELYLQRRARQEEAQAFGGSRDDFLRYLRTRVVIGPAGQADVPRLHELSVRTHQFNSAGTQVSETEFAALLSSGWHQVITVRLSDKFGDDGLVGACVLAVGAAGGSGGRATGTEPLAAHESTSTRPDPDAWDVPLLMMSCRAMGRGVIEALLAWVCRAAKASGAGRVRLACVITPRNVPLRIALTGSGFRTSAARAEPPAAGGGASRPRTVWYVRRLDEPLPALPDWAHSAQEQQ
jgi:FkbH-like protein